jgi:hypothetical protein
MHFIITSQGAITMTTIKCNKVYGDVLDQGIVEHGFTDKAGRTVGYQWNIRAIEFTDHDGEAYSSYVSRDADAPRHVFEMWGTPTRDGRKYGPSFNWVLFNTLEEARQAAVKRVEQARKRDTKKFAPKVTTEMVAGLGWK